MKEKKEEKVLYFHGLTVDECRFTVAGVFKGDLLNLGISVCSENDQFNKAKGRLIASGRIFPDRKSKNGHNTISVYNDDIDMENQFKEKDSSGFKENYFVGQEGKVFTEFVKNFNHFTKVELLQNFRLINHNK